MIINILLYVVLPIAAAIYFYFNRTFNFFKDRGIPYIKPKFPLGNMQGAGSKYHFMDIMIDIYEKCKGKDVLAGMYSFNQRFFMVLDLDISKNIMIKDFNSFVNRGGFVNEKDEPLTGHLLNVRDEKWKFLRNKLSPAFTSGKMKAMYHTISDKGHDYLELFDKTVSKNKAVDVKDITSRYTVDIISSVAFGMESNTMRFENDELLQLSKEVFEGGSLIKFLFMTAFPEIAKTMKMKVFSERISNFFMNVVSNNMETREKTNDKRQDFLNMLIQLKNKGSIDGEISTVTQKITKNEALAQSFVFFLASADNSSGAISFALCELAHNIEIQDKLRAEILEKTKKEGNDISYETLQEMTYLNQVVDETLRMYTAVSSLFREANEDYKIPNSKHVIPKGSNVIIPSLAFHFDDRYWKNPYKFDPDRFTQEEIAKRPNYCYLPFGDGPRNCIGMRYGLLTVKFGLALVIKNYKVTPNPKTHYPIKLNPKNPLMEALGGHWVNMEKI